MWLVLQVERSNTLSKLWIQMDLFKKFFFNNLKD